MKQVMPGVDLPVSYLSNSKGLEVEGSYGGSADEEWDISSGPLPSKPAWKLPIPGYKKQSGDFIIRWELDFEERAEVLSTSEESKRMLSLLITSHVGKDERVDPDAVPDINFVVAKEDFAALIRDGNLWQTVRSVNGCMFPVGLTARCPVLASDELAELLSAPPSFSRVLMSANGMINETGEANAYFVCCANGKYSIDGMPGEFATESAAIAELGRKLYGENNGKWSAQKDIAGRGPEEPMATGMLAPVTCPVCDAYLTKHGSPREIGWPEKYVNRMWCPKCQKKFVVVNGSAEDPEVKFIDSAIAGGLTGEVARLLWNTFGGKI